MTSAAQLSHTRRPRPVEVSRATQSRWVGRSPFAPRRAPAPEVRAVPRAVPQELTRLTDRELTILLAMATGATNAEIATDLFVSIATVKTHVARVLAKLGLRDRVQAVVFAYESRLVVPR
jgi:DNA-binding NarL/FixJ family response regulator